MEKDTVEFAEARFGSIAHDDGTLTHIAKVKFPTGKIVVGFGDTPKLAMEDAFRTYGAKKFSYSNQAAWTMPAWLDDEEHRDD